MYCPYCGQPLKDGEPHNCPNAPAGVYAGGLNSISTAPATPAVKILRETGSSAMTLLTALFMMVPTVYSFLSAVRSAVNLGESSLLSSGHTALLQIAVISLEFILFVSNMLIPVGMLLVWGACRNPQSPYIKTGGFTVMKASTIISLLSIIAACACSGLLVLLSYSSETIRSHLVLLLGSGAFVAVAAVLMLVYYLKIFTTINSAKTVAVTGGYDGKISGFVGVVAIIVAIINSLLLMMSVFTYGLSNGLVRETLSDSGISDNGVDTFMNIMSGVAGSLPALAAVAFSLLSSVLGICLLYRTKGRLESAGVVNFNVPYPAEVNGQSVQNEYVQNEYVRNGYPEEDYAEEEIAQDEFYKPSQREDAEEGVETETASDEQSPENGALNSSDAAENAVPEKAPSALITRLRDRAAAVVDKDEFTIGKSAEKSDFRIDANPTVSRVHAVIRRRGSSFFIADNNSTNGTFVNGVKVTDETEIFSGDEIRLSNEIFTFVIKERG